MLLLQQDRELPLLSMTVLIRGGSKDEPLDKTGLTDIFAESWRAGGTRTKTGDQIDDFLALRAANVETGSESTRTSLTVHSLKKDFPEVLGLAVEILREPEFRQDKIEIAKRQLFTAISRRNDEPGEIAGRAITQDLLMWHRRFVHAGNMVVGVSGDFEPAEMVALLKQTLGTLPTSPTVTVPEMGFVPTRPGLYFVPKREVNQSSIHLVQLGSTRKNPDRGDERNPRRWFLGAAVFQHSHQARTGL